MARSENNDTYFCGSSSKVPLLLSLDWEQGGDEDLQNEAASHVGVKIVFCPRCVDELEQFFVCGR
jgi:hypothetical protein